MLKQKIELLLNKYNVEISKNIALFSKYSSLKHLAFTIFNKASFLLSFITRNSIKHNRSRRSRVRFFVFTYAVVGVFGATKTGCGLNFNFSPHYSPNECQENNLKAMIVAMMMHNKLDEDELEILMNSIQAVYEPSNRKAWCSAEVKNFMKAAERFGNFQDERCTNFRKMLKSCLQSKKCAIDFEPPKISTEQPWPYNSTGKKYKPANLRKLPLSCSTKIVPTNDVENTDVISTEDKLDLNCCDDDTCSSSSGGCNNCDNNKTKGIIDDVHSIDSIDTWLTIPMEEKTSKTIKDKEARDWKYGNIRKDWGFPTNAVDYDQWCEQHGE